MSPPASFPNHEDAVIGVPHLEGSVSKVSFLGLVCGWFVFLRTPPATFGKVESHQRSHQLFKRPPSNNCRFAHNASFPFSAHFSNVFESLLQNQYNPQEPLLFPFLSRSEQGRQPSIFSSSATMAWSPIPLLSARFILQKRLVFRVESRQ